MTSIVAFMLIAIACLILPIIFVSVIIIAIFCVKHHRINSFDIECPNCKCHNTTVKFSTIMQNEWLLSCKCNQCDTHFWSTVSTNSTNSTT